MRARVIGLGSPGGGDDAAGPAVVALLRSQGVPPGVDLVQTRDPSALIDLLVGVPRAVVVDAAVGEAPPGTVLLLSEADLARGHRPVSGHALDLGQALPLARALYPESACNFLSIVAIAIEPPRGPTDGLSPELREALPRAAEVVRRILEEDHA